MSYNYTVLQIPMSDEMYQYINQHSHYAAIEKFPAYAARMKTLFQGSENFLAWMSEYFVPVCNIDAQDLDEVFMIGNIGTGLQLQRLERMHSVSVGDVIRCNRTGTYHMVDDCGFTQLLSFLELEVA